LPPPPRSEGGHRLYGPDLVARLQFVRRARDLGFTLEEIRELMSLVDGGNFTCGQIKGITLTHVEEIRQKIADLNRLKMTLEAMAAQCSGATIPECPIVEALFATRPPLPPAIAGSVPSGRHARGKA
jgi:MerR family mercuric resistance operon transcriptional regulator